MSVGIISAFGAPHGLSQQFRPLCQPQIRRYHFQPNLTVLRAFPYPPQLPVIFSRNMFVSNFNASIAHSGQKRDKFHQGCPPESDGAKAEEGLHSLPYMDEGAESQLKSCSGVQPRRSQVCCTSHRMSDSVVLITCKTSYVCSVRSRHLLATSPMSRASVSA